jgi:hypothetical protein
MGGRHGRRAAAGAARASDGRCSWRCGDALAGAAGARGTHAKSSDPGRLRCLARRGDRETRLWLANLRAEPLEVRLEGLPAGSAKLWTLDEDSFEAAIKDPGFGDQSRPFSGERLTLKPFAVAQLSFEG